MFCSKCGNALPSGTAFCPVCGAPAPASGAPAPAIPGTAVPALAGAARAVSPHWLPAPTRAYAGFWLRFVAHLIDSMLFGIVMIALIVPLAMMTGIGAGLRGFHPESGNPPDPAMIFAFISSLWIFIVVAILGGWLYYAYCESSEWQGTPGKKVLNIVVTDLNGSRVSFGRASGRFFSKLVTQLIPFGIGYIMAGFTEKKQALHDMIASCLVLRS